MDPPNRRARRAQQSARGKLTPLKGGKPTTPDTPSQRFGIALEQFVEQYLKSHSGLDAMNVTKVIMQYSVKMAIDHGADREQYLMASGSVFDEEKEA